MSTALDGLPALRTGIGVVTPYDFALDHELWRWTPPEASLHLTRLPVGAPEVTIAMVRRVGDTDQVRASAADLMTVEPRALLYACTSGSFINGPAGAQALEIAMRTAGAPAAVTTSGALLAALAHLKVQRVALATPYSAEITGGLGAFLNAAGLQVAGESHLGLVTEIWRVPYRVTADLVRSADRPDAQAVFVSCTNLATYDLIAPLEDELGKPVITANQVSMWAALRAVGLALPAPDQRLAAS